MQQKQIILDAIQKLTEDDFSKNILIPLLEKIGYTNLEFNGGSYEQGKDIIAHLPAALGKDEIHVFQSKKFKSKRSTASRISFSEYTYQLSQCIMKPIALSDGSKRRPNKVYFVTPYKIDSRHLEEQFEILSLPNIEVLDGEFLTDNILKHWPSFTNDIIPDAEIAIAPAPEEIFNIELNNALHIAEQRKYTEYYNDLNFFVGEVDSSLVFGGTVDYRMEKALPYSKAEWDELKKLDSSLKDHGDLGVIASSIADIEEKYQSDLNAHISVANTKLIKRSEDLRTNIASGKQKVTSTLSEALAHYSKIKETSENGSQFSEVTQTLSSLEEFQDQISNDTEIACPPRNGMPKTPYTTLRFLYDTRNEVYRSKKELLLILNEIIPQPVIDAAIDQAYFAEKINSKIRYAEEHIQKLNERSLTSGETKSILDEINSLLRTIDVATKQNNSVAKFSIVKGSANKNILDISAHSLFDSGCNIAIYGEAGAGKTTTLHMYAEKLYQNQQTGQIALFLPLNRITKKIGELDQNTKVLLITEEKPFESLLNAFLIYKNVSASTENRRALMLALQNSKKCIVIVDALDEASTHAPWVIQALSELPKNVTHAQVITSSRNCVKYIREIEFLGITLLPFTKKQLEKFITGWIGDSEQAGTLLEIIERKKLYDVAKNPLLATIICSLHTSNVPIPENEPELYWRKIELLCGLYDHHKGICRTKNEKSFLESCCIKLGYRFHRNEIRETSISEISKFLISDFENRYPPAKITSAIEDLIFSCNILIKQPGGENYGFEHLRYQELLAAKEIERNRSIDITGVIGKEWWKGPLYLYAFNHDIQFLIDEIYDKKGNISQYKETLMLMIEARPIKQRDNLIKLVGKLAKQDSFDGLGRTSNYDYGYDEDRAEEDFY
ncbi:NACHT domain-containing protein [Pseudomonas sp. EA_35y_Pfl2_R5]|uniref:NACHT domain-containing protein n=1 Tax=Pseudomonas sp. EA_35y_Pfl2_R5 TaxID=3088690 RepID=UPI0030DD595B